MRKILSVKELMKYLWNGVVVSITFRACGAVLSFFCIVSISRFYSVELLGLYVTIVAISTLLSIFVKVGQDVYLTKYLPFCDVNGLSSSKYIKDSIIVVSLASILMIMTTYFIIAENPEQKYFKIDYAPLTWTLAIAVPSIAFLQVFSGAFRGLYLNKLYLLFSSVSLHLTLLIWILMAEYLSWDIEIWEIYIFASASNAIIAGLVLYFCFSTKLTNVGVDSNPIGNRILKLVKDSYPMMISSSAMVIFGYTDIILINIFLDANSVGLYAGLIKVNALVSLVAVAVSNFIPALISESFYKKDFSSMKFIHERAQLMCWIVGGIVLLLILIFRDSYLKLLGPDFFALVPQYQLVCLLGALTILFGPQISVLNMIGEHKFVQLYSLIGLVLNVGLNVVLIPNFGISGALIATILATLVWKLAVFVRLRMKLRELMQT